MTFASVRDQDTAIQTLTRAVQRGQLHHAYCFEGPDGVGKELTALALAQAFACTNATAGLGCEQCAACQRVKRFVEGPPRVPQHPDVVLVARGLYPQNVVSAKETTGISVEQIRRVVLPRVAHGPHEARGLFVIIRNADELSVAAANSLLKSLEEPRSNVYFILLTSVPGRLLDTIRSRTLSVRFAPLSEVALRDILQQRGLDPEFASQADGSASAAIELAESGRAENEVNFARELDLALEADAIDRALELTSSLPKDRDEVERILLAYARHLVERARAAALQTPDLAASLATRYGLVNKALQGLERNGAPLAVVEALAAEIRATGC